MKPGIKSDVKSSSKRIARQTAKQIAQEPLEVLKTAGKQVTGIEKSGESVKQEPGRVDKVEKDSLSADEAKIKAKSKSLLEALEAEIEDIRKQKELEEEKKLKEEEAVARMQEQDEEAKPLPKISSKPSRKIPFGMKGKLQKLKRKVEIRMPPSG